MALPTVTVTGKFLNPDGTAAAGSISFTLAVPMTDAADNVIVPAGTVTARLDHLGAFSVSLVPSNGAGLAPTPVAYTVREAFGPGRTYYITVPSTPSTSNLADLAPASAAPTPPTVYLVKTNNLSDLASASTARTNLGLGSIATHGTSEYLTPAQGNAAYVAKLDGGFDSAKGVVCFSYDDSLAVHAQVAADHAARGQRATFGVVSTFPDAGQPQNYLTWAQIAAIYAQGHEIASHSTDHAHIKVLTAAQRAAEYDDSKTTIESHLGAGTVSAWFYPYGDASSRDAVLTDPELLGRYDRIVATVSGTPAPALADRFDQMVVYRIGWSKLLHGRVLDYIRMAAKRPIAVCIYTHSPGNGTDPDYAQVTEAMDLAQSLGIPCARYQDVFPSVDTIPNSGFENGLNGWVETNNNAGTTTCEVIADTPMAGFPGTKSLHLANTSTAGFTFVQGLALPVKPSTSYTISSRIRTSVVATAARGAYVAGVELDANGVTTATNRGTPINATAAWAKWSVAFTTSATTRSVIIQPTFESTQGDAWIDHLHLCPTSSVVLG